MEFADKEQNKAASSVATEEAAAAAGVSLQTKNNKK